MWGFILACISGALMSIQGVFNTEVTKQTGPWITNCFVQVTAFIVCVLFYIFSEMQKVSVSSITKVEPKYLLLGGVMGAFITLTVVKSMGALGPAPAILAIVITQITVGYLIELFGLFGVDKASFSWWKLTGMMIAVIGLVIFQWKK